ncbi:hypothetical protein SCLCIDRAFT_10888 [Scleroderma citrinum Foug A]|uniref:Uncharacterized protein n=1 Tax=Scleroderma citrinum Foug A TaxID=1036808 RepID=A0A0C2Z1U0_9AGAM|nr:hypothetical protein SCLCIDRAFT_10888 [Scleroderma citrinum Foug A]
MPCCKPHDNGLMECQSSLKHQEDRGAPSKEPQHEKMAQLQRTQERAQDAQVPSASSEGPCHIESMECEGALCETVHASRQAWLEVTAPPPIVGTTESGGSL